MLQAGKCKLCHNVKPLLNESHIIPDFMYSELFDKQNKINKFAPAEYVKGNRRVLRPSSGEYEGGILCRECDNVKLGGLENYARQALYGGTLPVEDSPICQNFMTADGIRFTRCRNISYRKFKLFLLSILWRASISSREFFEEVNLGPYEEELRQMLIDEDPKREEDFPIIIFTWLNDQSMPRDIVGQPGKNRAEDSIRYVFIIGGMTYVFYVSPGGLQGTLRPYTLLLSNEATFFHIPEGKTWELWQSYFDVK